MINKLIIRFLLAGNSFIITQYFLNVNINTYFTLFQVIMPIRHTLGEEEFQRILFAIDGDSEDDLDDSVDDPFYHPTGSSSSDSEEIQDDD